MKVCAEYTAVNKKLRNVTDAHVVIAIFDGSDYSPLLMKMKMHER